MARVVFAAMARRELRELGKWIAVDNPTAAESLIAEIKRRCHLRAAHPLVGEEFTTTQRRNVRRFSVGKYVVYFRPILDGIEVLRVRHGARGEEPRF